MSEQQTQLQQSDFKRRLIFALFFLVIGIAIGAGGFGIVDNSTGEAVDPSVVFEEIQSEDEMICASQQYNYTDKVEDSRTIPYTNIPIPFTHNSFWYRYVGTIKVGVNLQTATFEQDGQTVRITLDAPAISSNSPNMEESGVLEEKSNILNPINIKDVDAFQAHAVEFTNAEALEGGIIDEAKASAEQNLTDIFLGALGEGWCVEIVWRG